MNIKDLKPNSYNIVQNPTNISQLSNDSYSTSNEQKTKEPSLINKIGSIAGLDTIGKTIGAGIAYAIDPNVRKYSKEVLDDVPSLAQNTGATLKLASTIIPAGKLIKGGLALKGATAGGTYGLGQSLVDEEGLADTAKNTLQSAAGGAILGKATAVLPNVLKGAGTKITGIAMTEPQGETAIIRMYNASKPTLAQRVSGMFTGKRVIPMTKPTTTAETVAKMVLPGTEKQLGISATRVQKKLWKDVVSPALKSTKDKVDMKSFFNELENQIIKENPDLARRNVLLDALYNFKSNYSNVSKIGFEKLQDYKTGWAKFIPEGAYKGKPIASGLNEIRDMAANKARETIYNKLGQNLKQAYIDYGNLYNVIKEADTGSRAIDKMSLTRGIWEIIADKAITPITSFSGKVLYKSGQGLEYIGEKGMKNLGDIFGK